jgi:outer membrane protein assembly factor BamD
MKIKFFFSYILLIIFLTSCSNKEEKITTIKETNLESQMIEVYNQAMTEFERGDVIFAGKKFGEVELLYPQSIWAPRAVLMSAYGYFSQGYYGDAINDLERFLIKYKNHPQEAYAYYLLALCHYDQIVDEKNDLNEIQKSREYFELIINNYPNTDYAFDSKYKLELTIQMMASKEMYLARYYIEREKWIPAINRFKKVVNDYDTTIYVEEALHRLVELHYKVGLIDESKKYASLLGYNYQSGKWYEQSYKLINTNYKTKKDLKQDKRDSILKRFKKLFK